MDKKWTITGLILITTAIILGAFGAHALKDVLADTEKLQSFDTGVRFQMYHGIAFLSLPFLIQRFQLETKAVYLLLLVGVLFFSGSIYLLTLSHVLEIDKLRKIAGPITPIGGLLLIIGWSLVMMKVARSKKSTL